MNLYTAKLSQLDHPELGRRSSTTHAGEKEIEAIGPKEALGKAYDWLDEDAFEAGDKILIEIEDEDGEVVADKLVTIVE